MHVNRHPTVNPRIACTIALAVIAAVWALASSPSWAQPADPPKKEQPKEKERSTRVFKLRHAEAQEAADIITQLRGPATAAQVATDQRTNSIIVSATASALDEIEAIITALDAQQAAPKATPDVRVYTVANTTADEILRKTLVMGLPPTAQVTVDQNRNMVIVRGDAAVHQSVKELLAMLDRPVAPAKGTRSYRVKITWLIDASQLPKDANAPKEAPELPGDLTPVVEELKKIGVKDLRVAARTMVRGTSENPFSLLCKADIGEPCDLSLEGQIASSDTGRAPSLRLQITGRQARQYSGAPATATPTAPGGRGQGQMQVIWQEIVGIRTTIVAPAGHPVILGISPTDKLTSVFVVTVDED